MATLFESYAIYVDGVYIRLAFRYTIKANLYIQVSIGTLRVMDVNNMLGLEIKLIHLKVNELMKNFKDMYNLKMKCKSFHI